MSSPTYPAPTSPALSCVRLPAAAGSAHLMLVGELDLATAERARDAIRHAHDESRVLVCDLGDVWFIDVAGLRVLLDGAARARRTGARMAFAHCPPMVPRMLRVLGLEDKLELQVASESGGRRPHTDTRGSVHKPAGTTSCEP